MKGCYRCRYSELSDRHAAIRIPATLTLCAYLEPLHRVLNACHDVHVSVRGLHNAPSTLSTVAVYRVQGNNLRRAVP